MRSGMDAVAAARACVGARFRPQGRLADYGYDCVGVAGAAYGVEVPQGYTLRFADVAGLGALIDERGFRRVAEAQAGDLLLIRCGAEQLHLAVWTGGGFVQAHLGLGRVVETPGWPAEPVAAVFRPIGGEG